MKSAFLDGETSTVIVSMIAEPLSRFEEDGRMDETDTKIVQLILTLFRNLLCIRDSLHSNASAGDHMTRLKVHDHIPPVLNASFWPFPVADADDVLQRTSTNVRFCLSQDDLVQRFFTESVMEVILLIAQVSDVNFVLSVDCVTSTRYVPRLGSCRNAVGLQDANREPFIQDSALILEIMHEVFKGQSPQLLADMDKPHSHPGARTHPLRPPLLRSDASCLGQINAAVMEHQ
jgi:hypothetical protein